MDPPKAAHPHDPSQADRTTFEAAAGGEVVEEGDGVNGLGAEPVWFEHSAYARAESSYQRWLADQGQAPGSSGRHGDPAACHRQVLPTWVNEGARLPDFGPAEPRPFLELFRSAPPAPGPGPAPAPAPGPRRRSRSGQPRPAAERRSDAGAERPPEPPEPGPHAAGHAHRGHAPWRRGGPPRGRGHRWHRKRWYSEGEGGGSPWQQHYPHQMSAVQYLAQEKVWVDKSRYDEAERRFYEGVNGPSHSSQDRGADMILQDIARARENIQKSLAGLKTAGRAGRSSHHSRARHGGPTALYAAGDQGELVTRMRSLELENQSLHNVVQDLRSALLSLESRVALLERTPDTAQPVQIAPVHQSKVSAPVEEEEEDDDDDLDLFGSDEEDEEAERIREERVKQYAEKKAKKPALIAKSSILLDVKPWDDETDMARLEECVRSVQADGLLWGSSKLVPVGYGIRKLQIQCVVEDDKVGTDMLEEEITKFEYYVQSVDVAAFNKI
ncbi:elongation factor 1-delta-like isoform X3 [Conger conger]|uniref:elongation factor 1-delta-like isoform X3 n=1 Tax=Conger conger TaxID=82655 RepID=UPI002A5ADBC3|nr:elongation factor 1-delta-like isoform X3 [Conger conger]